MTPSYYALRDRRTEGEVATFSFDSDPATTGPWAPTLQHGGPPNALAVAAAEQVVADVTGRTDLVALRLASDFIGPVPVDRIDVRARVVRAARSAVLAAVTVSAGGRDCLESRVWFVRDADTADLATALPEPAIVFEGAPDLDSRFPYGESLEWRRVSGGLMTPGPGVAWARPRHSLWEDHDWTGLSRVVLIADSGNGLSSELDWTTWTFVNVDLDVHLARPPRGDWVKLDARTQLGAHGSALARSTLSDLYGVVGGGMQTLVVAPVRR